MNETKEVQDPEQRSKKYLESLVKDYVIIIDACSLIDENSDKFWSHIIPYLNQYSKKVVVPYSAYLEVRRFAEHMNYCEERNKENPKALNKRAISVVNLCSRLQQSGIIEIFADEDDDTLADQVIQSVLMKYRRRYNIVAVTQDKSLSYDISTKIGNSQSVQSRNKILARKINKYGYLSAYSNEELEKSAKKKQIRKKNGKKPVIPANEKFRLVKDAIVCEGPLNITLLPEKGSVLTARRGDQTSRIVLKEEIGHGGEGVVYRTNIDEVVAKIYKPEKLDKAKYEKLRLMITKDINFEGVCFPFAILFNEYNEFVGCLMKEAKGVPLIRCIFSPLFGKKYFVGWTRKETVRLCITILKKIKYLNDRNIILGDINPNNILVVSQNEVYLVDTDSYQVEEYPCPVGQINYTAPEIQGKPFKKILRTFGNEYFAVATLLFMIMHPGKPPYSLTGGTSQAENIIRGDFAYPCGENTNGKTPEGPWRYCWSHLPRYLKEDFYSTFRYDGEHHSEDSRFSTNQWLRKFESYEELLGNGKMLQNDPMSLDIWPTRFKRAYNVNYVICPICGKEYAEDSTVDGYCKSCLHIKEEYPCKKCGNTITYSNYDKYIKKKKRREICYDCYSRKQQVYTTIYCEDCGKSFDFTYGDKDFYDEKGLDYPKRCKKCRKKKKERMASGTYNSSGRSRASSSKNKGGCFLTTAVCQYLGKPDDCYELETFRSYRDQWLINTSDGKDLIQEYYEIAPVIVDQIDQRALDDQVYPELLEKYIHPCIRLIEEKRFEDCKNLYQKMVLSLKEKYYTVPVVNA